MSWKPRQLAKNKCKVDAALHRCSKCGVLCYEGKSEKNYEAFVEKYQEVVLFEGIKMDHIFPCIDPRTGFEGWDEFFKALFCDEINFRGLCGPCHDLKTREEDKIRGTTKKNIYFNPRKGKK